MQNVQFFLLKNKKTTSELKSITKETKKSEKYIFILDLSDMWNDYGFRTLIHLTVVYQGKVIIKSESFKGHSKQSENVDWNFDKLFDTDNSSSKLILDNIPHDIVTLCEISLYRKLFSNLPKEIVFEYLSKANDIAFDTEIMQTFFDESNDSLNLPDFITVSFFRDIFENNRWDSEGIKENIISDPEQMKVWEDECNQVQTIINILHAQISNGFSSELLLEIGPQFFQKSHLDSKIILRNNISLKPMHTNCFALIGANGIGKTTLLHSLLNDFQLDNATETTFSQVAMISFDTNTEIKDPLENDYRRLFIGAVHSKATDNSSVTSELRQNIIRALDKIVLNKRQQTMNTSLTLLKQSLDCFSFDDSITNLTQALLEYIDTKLSLLKSSDSQGISATEVAFGYTYDELQKNQKKLEDTINKMSSGQKMIFNILVSLSSTIMPKSLILIDEPENTLHPPFISALIDAINMLATEQDSLVILATHSPLIVRELTKQNVIIMTNDENEESIKLNTPHIQTFAASIDTLNDYIFGVDLQKSGHIKLLKELGSTAEVGSLGAIREKWDLTPSAMSYVVLGLTNKDK